MKFFKSFQILHRRTKSATFEAGPTISLLNSTSPPKPSSLAKGSVSDGEIPSILSLVISKVVPVPSNFNHIRPTTPALRSSTRLSQTSVQSQPIASEESARLREALDMWYSEYSNVKNLLQKCRADLAREREAVLALEEQSRQDQGLIRDLHEENARLEDSLPKASHLEFLTSVCPHCLHHLESDEPRSTLRPGSQSTSRLAKSLKSRTIDDYQSALRMTLAVRRQLREQTKITRFWKNKAQASVQQEGIVTPSSSAVSSINEPLPTERKAAVDSLMQERGLILPALSTVPTGIKVLPSNVQFNIAQPTCAAIQTQDSSTLLMSTEVPLPAPVASPNDPIAPIVDLKLASAPSNSSGISSSSRRLAPLASDSLKAEINTYFGIQESDARWFSSSKYKGLSSSGSGMSSILSPTSLSRAVSHPKATATTSIPPKLDLGDLKLPIEPYGDLGWIFQMSTEGSKDGAVNTFHDRNYVLAPDSPWQILDTSGSTLADSALASGSSSVFAKALSSPTPHGSSNTPGYSGSPWQRHLENKKYTGKIPRKSLSRNTDPVSPSPTTPGRLSVSKVRKSLARFKKPSRLPVPVAEKA